MRSQNPNGNIFDKIGGHGRYQFFLFVILFFLSLVGDFYMVMISFMEVPPIVDYTPADGNTTKTQINYTICNDKTGNYTINDESKPNWVLEYKLFCNKSKVGFIGSSIFLGSMFTGILSPLLQKIGPKISIIISVIALSISTAILLIFHHNYYILISCNTIFGFAFNSIMISKNTLLTNVTDTKYRSYFIGSGFAGFSMLTLFAYFLFSLSIDWKYFYFGNAIISIVLIIIFCLFAVESPNFYYDKKDYKNYLKCAEYIAKINNRNEYTLMESPGIALVDEINEINLTSETIGNTTSVSGEIVKYGNKENIFKVIKLGLCFFIYIPIIITVLFRTKLYINTLPSFYYYMNELVSICLIYTNSFLMNLKCLGRKYTLVMILGFSIISVAIKYTNINNIEVIGAFVSREVIGSLQVVLHTFVTESLSENERLKYYGMTFTFGKFASILASWYSEFMPQLVFDITVMVECVLVAIIILMLEETLKKRKKSIDI